MKPLVSVIMPVKNAAPYLSECLDSICKQTLHSWELILVDDHSSDESEAIAETFCLKDSRITLYKNPGSGIIEALKKAFAHTSGQYITRMDADDIMPEYRLEKMLNAIQFAPPKTVVTGMVRYFSSTDISPGYRKYEHWLNEINRQNTQWENIYRECVIASPNWMAQKTVLEQINAFEDLLYPEDYHLVLKWYQHRFNILTLPEITLHWREHERRTSRNSSNYQQEAFFKLKIQVFLKLDWNKERLIVWGNNPKTKLTTEILQNLQIPHIQLGMKNYQKIEQQRKAQILIGVYPIESERNAIIDYLHEHRLVVGKDCWFL